MLQGEKPKSQGWWRPVCRKMIDFVWLHSFKPYHNYEDCVCVHGCPLVCPSAALLITTYSPTTVFHSCCHHLRFFRGSQIKKIMKDMDRSDKYLKFLMNITVEYQNKIFFSSIWLTVYCVYHDLTRMMTGHFEGFYSPYTSSSWCIHLLYVRKTKKILVVLHCVQAGYREQSAMSKKMDYDFFL